MDTTTLSSKGQVIIPKAIRTAYNWQSGQELQVLESGDGILLRPRSRFETSTLDEVAGSLPASGKPKSLKDMENAIAKGARERAK
ncbi:MAG: AbrB/MazE/SpoVT family DNA-binding domain-containing protein [Verrucomicrobia bacterium]|nr:AbrB/MazE/SpoVT family DNA-binding domain-containing protein [Verrucomicrobiota bacterium]MCH8512823.1 AbrB/MazE/SpoVT family DNA-binding domain-containing protein [Kiritimatiellia bacterium]